MSEAEIIGFTAIGLTAFVSLFMVIYKPLNENTKAMTVLNSNIEHLAEKIEGQEKALLEYKEHVRDSQKRQWEKLEEHNKAIQEVNHALELCKQEHEKE